MAIDDYLEDDDNDDNEDDDLVESEYERSDGVSGTRSIPIIKVKEKGETKQLKLKKYYRWFCLSLVLGWRNCSIRKKLTTIRILNHKQKLLITEFLAMMIL